MLYALLCFSDKNKTKVIYKARKRSYNDSQKTHFGNWRTPHMTTILLADDHAVLRQGLRALLEEEPDFSVVAEASGGLDAIRMCKELKPSVLVLDIMMDDINGIEVIRQIKETLPHTGVVVLSMYGDKKHILNALQAGAMAYVVKKSASDDLVRAVREVVAGKRYLGPELADIVVDAYLEKADSQPANLYEMLSAREREVLNMAAHGFTNSEIAERLCISRRTVETHRSNAMNKLQLDSQTDLLRFALKEGILPLDQS